MKLTLNQERYVETIYELCEEHGHAHTKAIAEALEIRMASVTEAIRALSEKNLVNYEVRKTITLTEEGLQIAKALAQKHRVLATFLIEVLGCKSVEANKIACRIEHVIGEDFKQRVTSFTEFIKEKAPEKLTEFKQQYDK
ncbi:metal-dependent transcriptional regulator [Lentisphaerota bacterium WC36G]|nr:metal-dependent transcriptional regulator [Lentisphaerae bacterium WC36]